MNTVHFTSTTEEWSTPQELFDQLDSEFHFTLDPCSTDENAKCEKHYTKADDGLSKDWTGEVVWCNPPYGRKMTAWILKCYQHFLGGGCCGDADTGTDGHQRIPRLHFRKGGNTLHQGTDKVWRCEVQCAVSFDDCGV